MILPGLKMLPPADFESKGKRATERYQIALTLRARSLSQPFFSS